MFAKEAKVRASVMNTRTRFKKLLAMIISNDKLSIAQMLCKILGNNLLFSLTYLVI